MIGKTSTFVNEEISRQISVLVLNKYQVLNVTCICLIMYIIIYTI